MEGPIEDSSTETEKAFHFKAKAGLFTWNGDFTESDFGALWEQLTSFEPKTMRLSAAMELNKEGAIHFHAFMQWDKQLDRAGGFEFKGQKPRIDPNSGRNINRGHYYCQAPKIGVLAQQKTDSFLVIPKREWIVDLWKQEKMTKINVEKEALRAKCWTPQFKAHIQVHKATKEAKKVKELMQSIVFDEDIRDFKEVPEWNAYMEHFEKNLRRYPIFILVGPSKVGKTQWARHMLPTAFIMEKEECWNAYDYFKHEAVIFEDFSHPWKYILENRTLLQGTVEGGIVQRSPTNCFARRIYLWKKPKIFLLNFDTFNAEQMPEWIRDNSVVAVVQDKLYLDATLSAFGLQGAAPRGHPRSSPVV